MKTHTTFKSIIFLQGEPALTALRLLEDRRLNTALSQLREFEMGDEQPEHDGLNPNRPWGSGDTTYRCGDYMMAANHKLQYVSLAKRF